jgi:quinol-cytochrome oxidoreductase complex cytochrome b subunit
MPTIFPFLHVALILSVVLNEFLRGTGLAADRLFAGVFVGFWLHALISMYRGEFYRLRTKTFLVIAIAVVADQIASFMGYVLPAGQVLFWFASLVPGWLVIWLPSDLLAFLSDGDHLRLSWHVVLLLLLILDLIVAQRWTGRWSMAFAVIAGLGSVTLVVNSLQLSPVPAGGHADAFAIVPHWSALPGYSILRAVPDKLLGVIVFLVATLLPLTIPWIAAERLRSSRIWFLWLLNCLALAASLVWLGSLGLHPPDEHTIQLSQIAAACYAATFLLVPWTLRLFTR